MRCDSTGKYDMRVIDNAVGISTPADGESEKAVWEIETGVINIIQGQGELMISLSLLTSRIATASRTITCAQSAV